LSVDPFLAGGSYNLVSTNNIRQGNIKKTWTELGGLLIGGFAGGKRILNNLL
ncbi:hypothetical protein SAMN04490243_2892, partial [Robiginitalea myxolifaciens]